MQKFAVPHLVSSIFARRSFLAVIACLSVFLPAGAQAAPRREKPVDASPAVARPAVEKVSPSVLRAAPDFTWEGAGGKAYSVKKLRGQPVVLLIASSPNASDLRKQAEHIEKLYLQFSAKKAVFIAAFTAEKGRVMVDVPFAIAADGPGVAAAYGAGAKGLSVVVIGPDGNVDMKAGGVQAAQRILDIINNSYRGQAAQRVGQGG